MTTRRTPPTALVTGGSSGLGLALARYLDDAGWIVVTDARDDLRLQTTLTGTTVHGVPGDVADPDHRAALVEIVSDLGGLDLLVLNHSTLGPLPMRPLARFEPAEIGEVFRTNAGAPGSLMIALTEQLRDRDGVVIGISSDAAVQHYETWGRTAPPRQRWTTSCSPSARRPAWRRTPWTPATCAPRCTRTPSRARTSPTGPCRDRRAPAARTRAPAAGPGPVPRQRVRPRPHRHRGGLGMTKLAERSGIRFERPEESTAIGPPEASGQVPRRGPPARRQARRRGAPRLPRPARPAAPRRPRRGEQLRHGQRRDRRRQGRAADRGARGQSSRRRQLGGRAAHRARRLRPGPRRRVRRDRRRG